MSDETIVLNLFPSIDHGCINTLTLLHSREACLTFTPTIVKSHLLYLDHFFCLHSVMDVCHHMSVNDTMSCSMSVLTLNVKVELSHVSRLITTNR